MDPVSILPGLDWVGTLDPHLRVFDVIMRAEHGTTYNSYLVRGKDKTALIETSKGIFACSYLETLRKAIDPAKIDYLILNHMEPDHSGALAALLEAAPNIKVFLTRAGHNFAKNVANRDFDAHVVTDGEILDLGERTLKFIVAPYLHWPDTMMTYLAPDGVLFSCDFMGAHYCDARLFNDLLPDYDHVFRYYFMAIMRPFKEHVRNGLKRLDELELNMVCPSHGPIIRKNIGHYTSLYREFSKELPPRDKKRLLIFYVSAYGSTEAMANAMARGAEGAGAEVKIMDLSGVDMNYAVDEVEAADGIAVGSATINGDAIEHAWLFLASFSTISVKKKLGAAFGSYGWSGEGPKMISDRLLGLKFRVPEPPLRVQLVPTEEDLATCAAFGARLAAAL